MTAVDEHEGAAPDPHGGGAGASPATASSPAERPGRGNPWRPSLKGIALATRIELLRRRPSPKGRIFYGAAVGSVLVLSGVVAWQASGDLTSTPLELTLILALAAGMLIGPSLSATSINGDSTEGVLAPLQMTRLTAGDLALGKLLAAWAYSLAVLVTTVPVLAYAFSRSGWTVGELAIVLAAIVLAVLVATAIGLAWSALAARAVASVSLAHLTTAFLLVGTLLVYFFIQPLLPSVTQTVTNRWPAFETDEQWQNPEEFIDEVECIEDSWTYTSPRTELAAWILLLNPAVMLAETAPVIDPLTWEEDGRAAPGAFSGIHQAVGSARLGPEEARSYDECAAIASGGIDVGGDSWAQRQQESALMERSPWLGLAVQALLLAGSLVIAIRRLRVPYRTLRGGTRVA
ncbi:ABC transporter permease [Demequina pelophila]|uniref:ABC transporter permease n=1 Tax=Demequina pelophila TaxID=1638984 RepID=UPI0007864846|nr:ABC transporter permease [Demequina pelophila]